MTIVEIERVSAPDIERRDAREERARILEAAALEIEVRGWHACGYTTDGCGPVCLVAATVVAAGRHDLLATGGMYAFARSIWGEVLHSDATLPGWNDTPERTADEVTFLLRWKASEVRDGR